MPDSFVASSISTEYSLLDGMNRAEDVAKRAAELGMPAVAMTDHGNLFGAIEFYNACQKALGRSRFSAAKSTSRPARWKTNAKSPDASATHPTLLASTNEGWGHLQKLVSVGHLQGLYHGKPRVDRQQLARYAPRDHRLAPGASADRSMNGCAPGTRTRPAERCVNSGAFGAENTYVEIHTHGLQAQLDVLPHLLKLARELSLKPVAANDVHFLKRGDHEAHDVMICIGTRRLLVDEYRMRYSPEVHFKTAGEMRVLFADVPGACDATLEIAEKLMSC